MGALIYFLISHTQFWVAAVIAYFCGCFNGAVIVSKYILRDDVRNHGSGNAGLTNFFRTFGGPLTFVVILCDVLKAVVAIKVSVWLGGYFDPRIMPDVPLENQALLIVLFKYWGGLFCLLGHMFPCMFQFKGGKGILSGDAPVDHDGDGAAGENALAALEVEHAGEHVAEQTEKASPVF